jgi:predicted protein tyrosine phosphatase
MSRPFVPFDISVCGIPELEGYCEARVSHVLSILDPGAPEPHAFGAFGEHERLELRFHDVIDERPGLLAPQPAHVEELLGFGLDLLREPPPGAHLLVHCHAGVSRSTAAMTVLLAQARPDRPAAEAVAEVVRVRPQAWPNLRVVELGDGLLGRGGELVAAVRAHYRAVAGRRPDVAQAMAAGGRGREVAGIDVSDLDDTW